MLAVEQISRSHAASAPLSTQTPRQYLEAYNARRGSHYSRFHGYAYDGIWVIALAIDSILKQSRGAWTVADLRSSKMHDALNDTDFMGVTVRAPLCPLETICIGWDIVSTQWSWFWFCLSRLHRCDQEPQETLKVQGI